MKQLILIVASLLAIQAHAIIDPKSKLSEAGENGGKGVVTPGGGNGEGGNTGGSGETAIGPDRFEGDSLGRKSLMAQIDFADRESANAFLARGATYGPAILDKELEHGIVRIQMLAMIGSKPGDLEYPRAGEEWNEWIRRIGQRWGTVIPEVGQIMTRGLQKLVWSIRYEPRFTRLVEDPKPSRCGILAPPTCVKAPIAALSLFDDLGHDSTLFGLDQRIFDRDSKILSAESRASAFLVALLASQLRESGARNDDGTIKKLFRALLEKKTDKSVGSIIELLRSTGIAPMVSIRDTVAYREILAWYKTYPSRVVTLAIPGLSQRARDELGRALQRDERGGSVPASVERILSGPGYKVPAWD